MDGNSLPYTVKKDVYDTSYDGSIENGNVKPGNLKKERDKEDPWALPDLENTEKPWKNLSNRGKLFRVTWIVIRLILLLAFLYFFICSLTFLSNGFKLVGGKKAGEAFRQNQILSNPVAGVMLGVLATVLVQSSSTTTSIVVGMVSGGLLTVQTSIPIIMGANIGTSVTNTIVSLGQIADKDDFRRAFAGATVHDMFNWLNVLVLLPIEIISGFLFHLSEAIVKTVHPEQDVEDHEYLDKVTKPFTNLIIILDSKKITAVAKGSDVKSLLKDCCEGSRKVNVSSLVNESAYINTTFPVPTTWQYNVDYCTTPCEFAFKNSGLKDEYIGAILLVCSLLLLCVCLLGIVKTLNSVLKGNIRKVIRKFVNYDFPGKWSYFTGYIAILIGTGLTFLVQSSSIFTSTLTPLVGVGVISLERMYPLTLGANIGTTTTAIIAALAASGDITLPLESAMCHLFFNIFGIIIFYPIPFMRFPITLAKFLGMETSKYRWYAVVYLILMFFIFPAVVFGLSLAGWYVALAVLLPIGLIVIIIGVIKVIQNKRPQILPEKLKNWKFLPVYMRSLEPINRNICGAFKCKCCSNHDDELEDVGNRRPNYLEDTRL